MIIIRAAGVDKSRFIAVQCVIALFMKENGKEEEKKRKYKLDKLDKLDIGQTILLCGTNCVCVCAFNVVLL